MTDTSNQTDPAAELEQLRNELATERENRLVLERRTVFAEAGLSDHPARELLENTFETGMTSDQLKETAARYGLLADPAAPTDATDLDALRRVTSAGTGGTPTNALPDFGEALDGARSLGELEHLIATGGAGAGIGLKGRVV